MDDLRGARSKRFQSCLEDLRPRLVRTDGLRRDHRIEPQAVALEDSFQEYVVRVRNDGAWDAIERVQGSRDFRIGLRFPPTRFQGFDNGSRVGLDAMIPEGFAEALLRELRQGLEGFRVGTRVQIPVPRGKEGVRSQGRPVGLADLTGDSNEHV